MEYIYRYRIAATTFMVAYLSCCIIADDPVVDLVVEDQKIILNDACQYPVPVGMEKNYIPDQNIWATSMTNSKRGPQYARLRGWRGGGAWTAGTTDDLQYLGIDLGYRQVIMAVATQGRRGSREYVLEYYLQFSSDNITWNIYSNAYGTPMLFEGNTDDNTVKKNNLQYPIIARYIRINPQRWFRFISLRAELYGCRFDAEGAQFDGQSAIVYDISGPMQYVKTRNDSIIIRFRTTQANGLLLYADSNQGDYIIVELVRGRLHLNLDLGSTANISGDTTMHVGSLLDDNQWHDVEIKRDGRDLKFNVDRLTLANITQGDFIQLDLDRKIYLGGLDNFIQPGKRLLSRSNFTGCMENVWFNDMSIIKDARVSQPRFQISGNINFGSCRMASIVPFTFPSVVSYLVLTKDADQRVRVSFDFRAYNVDGLLFMVNLNPNKGKIWVKINLDGYIEYNVDTGSGSGESPVRNTIANNDIMSENNKFTDGWWHSVSLDVSSSITAGVGRVSITVDGYTEVSTRKLTFNSDTLFYIGGGDDKGGQTGFLGCMRSIIVQGGLITDIPIGANIGGVLNGTCDLQDRCDPNPCEHGGICSQQFETFNCDCGNSGYTGAVCHISSYLVSCAEAKLLYPMLDDMDMMLDIDDSGPLNPFPVKCVFQDQQNSIMELYHDSGNPTLVDGYPGPGSYVRPVVYNALKEEIDNIILRAVNCEQYIKYECWQSKLLTDAGSANPNVVPSWGWWVGRHQNAERYWGGSSPDSNKCACGLRGECRTGGGGVGNNPCNCDASLAQEDVFDDGYIIDTDRLPVMELHFGDTGNLGDQKWGRHTLGPLRCYGDALYENIVTFTREDATIELPTYPGAVTGDIRFQFKTNSILNGVILQNTGPYNFIEVRLIFGNIIQFRYDVGNGIQTLEKMTAYPLNDDNWHTVHVERNRKQGRLRVDLQSPVMLDEPTDQEFRPLILDSPLVVGAAVDLSEGFVGCVRAMLVSGETMDLRGIVESGKVTYGVLSGCHPKCESNPCYNNGVCVEWYSRYQCDCAYTPFRGWDCGREMGVNMQPDYMLKYTFDKAAGDISTDEENIFIGFSTQEKHGILMQIKSDSTTDYMSIEVNNNGGVKVIIDVGWFRDEVNTDIFDVDLANGQQHVVHVTRVNHGSKMIVQVDQYTPAIKQWEIPPNADSRLNSPRWIYFGRNDSSPAGTGFKGCLFRAQWDNQFPIARVFQDPRGPQVEVFPPNKIHEDMCGFEEYTHSPEPLVFRPTPPSRLPTTTPRSDVVGGGLNTEGYIILGICIGVGILVLLLLVLLLVRYYYKQKREYKTYEAKDAQYFDSADYAIASGLSKHEEVPNKREYFI